MAETTVASPLAAAKPFIGCRKDAISARMPRYIDGRSCGRRHTPTVRLSSNSQCIACRDLKLTELAALRKPPRTPGFAPDIQMNGLPVFVGSRSSANAAGARFYINHRRVCSEGHTPTIRLVSTTACTQCGFNYYAAHKDQISEAKKAQRAQSLDEYTAAERARYAANPAYFQRYAQAWAKKNPERKRSSDANWRKANQEYLKNYYSEWGRANPDKAAAKAHKRRAAKLGSTEHFTASDVQQIFALQRGKCAYCRKKLKTIEARDHIIALSVGGSNGRRNIQITCAPCNSRKGNRDPIDFVQRNFGLLL